MLLEQKDLQAINRIIRQCVDDLIFKAADEFGHLLARGFERLDERIDASEARFYNRLADLENLLAQKDK